MRKITHQAAKDLQVPMTAYYVHKNGSLRGQFCSRRSRHPADAADDAAGAEGVFVGSGTRKSGDPARSLCYRPGCQEL